MSIIIAQMANLLFNRIIHVNILSSIMFFITMKNHTRTTFRLWSILSFFSSVLLAPIVCWGGGI